MCHLTHNILMAVKSEETELQRLVKVINILKQNSGGLWLRELSRQSKLHLEIIRRLMEKYPTLFENYADFTAYKINFKIIKLRNPNVTPTDLSRYVKLRGQE